MSDETRRAFLKRIGHASLASLAAGGALRPRGACGQSSSLPTLATRPETDPIDAAAKSLVAHIRRPEVVDRQKIHEILLREMIEDGIRTVTGIARPADAWQALIKPDDIVGIKFNHVGAAELDTTDVMAAQLVKSLSNAGIGPDRIMLIEVDPRLARSLETRPQVFGFSGDEVSFGSGVEQLSAVLQEVTAIVNVPFLKTHNIAGVTGCLKNLSHALVRRPGRYHADGCAPFVGDIVALPQIRSKLRVHIVNAVRAVYDGGPDVERNTIWHHGGLIVSTDPVAADAVGVNTINHQRARAKLPAVGDRAGLIPHIHAAARVGLGTDDQDYINLRGEANW